MAKKAAVRYPDFTIVFRKDRNGYEGWYGGKAEAFRKTKEKVDGFFQKKYGQPGQVLESVRTYDLPAPHAVVVRKPVEAKAPPAPKAQAPKVKAPKAPKAPKVMEFEPETFGEAFEAEDRLDHADLDALL
jgi:hypothetical protein